MDFIHGYNWLTWTIDFDLQYFIQDFGEGVCVTLPLLGGCILPTLASLVFKLVGIVLIDLHSNLIE